MSPNTYPQTFSLEYYQPLLLESRIVRILKLLVLLDFRLSLILKYFIENGKFSGKQKYKRNHFHGSVLLYK